MSERSVLFINRSLNGGGSERVMSIIASYFAEQGVKTEMVLVDDEPKVYPVSDKVKITEMHLPMKGNKLIWHIRRHFLFRKIMKKSDASTVVSFLWDMNMKVMIASLGLKKRIVLSERNDPLGGNRRKSFQFACKYIFPLADFHVFQTTDVQEYFSSDIQKKSCVIANPISIRCSDVYRGKRESRIVAAGRLAPQKNFAMLIDAFAVFHQHHPEYLLEIYGEGALRKNLMDQIEKYGLSEHVILKGYVSDLKTAIRSAAIYVSSSDFEGISNTMLEAMALAIPSICTDCPVGGARMVIDSGVNGILIPVGDTESLIQALEDLTMHQDKAQQISKYAEKVRDRFSIEAIGQRWMKVCFPQED